VALRHNRREGVDARCKGPIVAGDVARAGARQLVVDGQAVGVACGEGHLGEAAEVEHPRLPEVLARASARLAPHARVRSDGGAHLDLHGHRHDPAVAEVALLAEHLEVVGRRVWLRRGGLGQAWSGLAFGFGLGLGLGLGFGLG